MLGLVGGFLGDQIKWKMRGSGGFMSSCSSCYVFFHAVQPGVVDVVVSSRYVSCSSRGVRMEIKMAHVSLFFMV